MGTHIHKAIFHHRAFAHAIPAAGIHLHHPYLKPNHPVLSTVLLGATAIITSVLSIRDNPAPLGLTGLPSAPHGTQGPDVSLSLHQARGASSSELKAAERPSARVSPLISNRTSDTPTWDSTLSRVSCPQTPSLPCHTKQSPFGLPGALCE